MRKLLTLLTLMLTAFSLSAKDVTPEEALQKATQFIAKKHQAGGARLAPGAVPQLTLAAQPSGLYVFNVKDSQGFVIVSPDDCTEAILGYSESGTFNEETMPENMRAWLDGYARQIAWAQQNNIQVSNAPRQDDRAPVEPLVTAHWDQGAPFYNSCPKKGSRYTYTGCVATAMTQVMYYHKWPNQTQSDIPAYTTAGGIQVNGVTAGATIDWGNMLEGYGTYWNNGVKKTQSSNNAQKKAVADLMFYCGASTRMEYTTSSSGTISAFIAPAFIDVFGYDKTTRLIDRSIYSDSQWEEIMYYEVSNMRPVVYSGTTANEEGHEFVCDGYQSDGYFHINWGWANSDDVDGYFKLSALDPDSQGIGGASSGNAFNYYQDAVIGIQPSGAGGSVSGVVFDGKYVLEASDVTVSPNPVKPGGKVTVTATVKNLGSNRYNNGIYVIEYDTEEEKYVNGSISAGGQKTITVTFDAPTDRDYMQFILAGLNASGGTYLPLFFAVTEQVTIAEEVIPDPTTVDVTIGENGWGVFNSTYGLDFSGSSVTAYVVTGETDGIITKRQVSKVPAQTGLLINGTANQTYAVNTTSTGFDDVTDNKLVAQLETKNVGRVGGGTVRFFFGEQDGQVGFAYPSSSSVEVNAGEAYLALTGTSSDYAEKTWLPLEESATGIERTTIEGTVTDGYYYTLDGRRVTNPTKGIYIYQGKKVLVK